MKAAHTVNAGSAKPGANSFTQGQARQHIEHAGFSNVSGLIKGRDGVWRGTASLGGQPMSVALDFKGNVTHGAPADVIQKSPSTPRALTSSEPSSAAASGGGAMAAPASEGAAPAGVRHRHGRRRHHHGLGRSGIDRNRNGISDKEDRALQHGHG